MSRWKFLAMTAGLALMALAILPKPTRADEWDKKTYLTVNEPLVIPGKILQPGKYIMQLADSQSNRHIVQIFNADGSRLETTILAIPNYRLQPKGSTTFDFWELPNNEPRALKAWFYPGDNFGQEFAYPKKMAEQIAQQNQQVVPTVGPEGQVGQVAPQTEGNAAATAPPSNNQSSTAMNENSNAAATAPSTSEQNEASPQSSSQPMNSEAQTAENQPPANEQMNQPSSTETLPARTLPSTASPFPIIGFAGLFSLGLALAARVAYKRV